MTPPRFLVLAFAATLVCVTAAARADESTGETTSRNVRGIVELFTSQGCAECPRADAVMMVRTLLKSCAMPPARLPIACIFWLLAN